MSLGPEESSFAQVNEVRGKLGIRGRHPTASAKHTLRVWNVALLSYNGQFYDIYICHIYDI